MPYSMACHIVWHFFKLYFFAEAFIIINWKINYYYIIILE